MLRANLSTRPFYNERLVHLLIALGAVIVLAVTLANVGRLVSLSRHNTALSSQVEASRTEATRLNGEATRIRRGLDQKELAALAAAAREANRLIDQRTFSWTAFFNRIEETMPPDVMLQSVRPTIDDSGTQVSMVVIGRTSEDLDEFMEKLEATGAFESILPRQQERTDEGLQQSIVDARYVPEGAEEPPGTGDSGEPAPDAPARTSASMAAAPSGAAPVAGGQR